MQHSNHRRHPPTPHHQTPTPNTGTPPPRHPPGTHPHTTRCRTPDGADDAVDTHGGHRRRPGTGTVWQADRPAPKRDTPPGPHPPQEAHPGPGTQTGQAPGGTTVGRDTRVPSGPSSVLLATPPRAGHHGPHPHPRATTPGDDGGTGGGPPTAGHLGLANVPPMSTTGRTDASRAATPAPTHTPHPATPVNTGAGETTKGPGRPERSLERR
jgi:hypothetical protein